MMSVDRIIARYIRATEEVPVRNKELDRIVWVLPETLREDSSKYERINPRDLIDPQKRGKPKPPQKPRKPSRPTWHKVTLPAPVKPPIRPKPVKPPAPVKHLKPLKPIPIPVPPKSRKWKVEKPHVREAV